MSSNPFDGWFLRRLPSGAPVWLCCQREVSAFMGWDLVFEPYYEGKGLPSDTGAPRFYKMTKSMSPKHGGSQFRILRGPRRGVFTPGLTHAFRLRGTWSPKDLRQVMTAVQVDWNWLKFPDGRVWDKERLVQSSQPGPPRGSGLSR